MVYSSRPGVPTDRAKPQDGFKALRVQRILEPGFVGHRRGQPPGAASTGLSRSMPFFRAEVGGLILDEGSNVFMFDMLQGIHDAMVWCVLVIAGTYDS